MNRQPKTKLLLFIVLIVCNVLLISSLFKTNSITALASGNQVITRNENGVLYLTTEVTETGVATRAATTRNGRTLFNIARTEIAIPTGYATTIANFINAVLSLVMVISALLVFMYLLMGGFQWITSGGDKGKIDQARQKLTAAVIGLVIVSASYAILLLALQFLGFSNLEDVFNNMRTINDNTLPATGSGILNASPSATPSSNSLEGLL